MRRSRRLRLEHWKNLYLLRITDGLARTDLLTRCPDLTPEDVQRGQTVLVDLGGLMSVPDQELANVGVEAWVQ